MLSIIGEDLEYVAEITGIVLSNRPRADAISIWIRDCFHSQAINQLTSDIERVLANRRVLFSTVSFTPHQKGLVNPLTEGSGIPKLADSARKEGQSSASSSTTPLQSIPTSRSASDLTSPSLFSGFGNDVISSSAARSTADTSPGDSRKPKIVESSLSSSSSVIPPVGNGDISVDLGSFHRRHQSYSFATSRPTPFRRNPSSRAASPNGFSSGNPEQVHLRTRLSDGVSLKDRLQVAFEDVDSCVLCESDCFFLAKIAPEKKY